MGPQAEQSQTPESSTSDASVHADASAADVCAQAVIEPARAEISIFPDPFEDDEPAAKAEDREPTLPISVPAIGDDSPPSRECAQDMAVGVAADAPGDVSQFDFDLSSGREESPLSVVIHPATGPLPGEAPASALTTGFDPEIEHKSSCHHEHGDGSSSSESEKALCRDKGDVVMPAIASGSVSAPDNVDDHSYQWHALQSDNDDAPVVPWTDEETERRPAPGAPRQKNSTGKGTSGGISRTVDRGSGRGPFAPLDLAKPIKHDIPAAWGEPLAPSQPAEAVGPDESAQPDDAEGLLDYESSAASDDQGNESGGGNGGPTAATCRGGGWTLPVLCAGIGVIACCLLIPLCDANRRAAYERLGLRRDLESLQHQVATNDQFLHKVASDPTLAERLAQRQMRKIRAGTGILPLNDEDGAGQKGSAYGSPFAIVAVPPPPELAPYQPIGGHIATMCYNPHTRLYLMGAGLMLMAAGLVMGYTPMGGNANRKSSRTGGAGVAP